MKDNRHKWNFTKHPAKPSLTNEEVRYWTIALSRLLKIGIEFEFNLPDQKGTCKGTDVHCPCTEITKGCWKVCTNTSKCSTEPYIETCKNRSSSCKLLDCSSCKKYDFNCLSTNCVEFLSACFVCENFKRSCNACPKKYNPMKDPANIRQTFISQLNPSNSYGKINSSGVVSVTTDGSLSGDKGAEIITVGRRVDYWEFFTMVKRILDMASEHGAYVNERCSSHMHILTSYFDDDNHHINELERDMPEIIMSNFHQLCRRYQNAITWMTMALDQPQHLTRWEKFRVSVLEVSPLIRSMVEVSKTIMDKSAKMSGNGKDKYGWVNYKNTSFRGDGIKKFHVEMRVADSTMCPSYYAAMACLFYALVIKAVQMSRYGVLNVGNEEWINKSTAIKDAMMNNGSASYDSKRVSMTDNIMSYKDELVAQSFDLIDQMKSILIKLGPAYDVLAKLARNPVALRRVEGYKWVDIENDLAVQMKSTDYVEYRMNEIIDMRYIAECHSIEEWVEAVSQIINDSKDPNAIALSTADIQQYIETKSKDGELIWSSTLGAMITMSL